MLSRISLYRLDGTEIDLASYGLFGLSLVISSPSYTTTKETVEGRPGTIGLGKTLESRSLIAKFKVDANDYSDSLVLRDELFSLFNGDEKFYISESKQPDKRWLVESVEGWTPERLNARTSTISLNLLCEEGLAESIETSLEMDSALYTYSTNTFTVHNFGNVLIDPRFMDLEILINANTVSYIELINSTTGDVYRHDGALNTNDTLRINGIRTTKNNLSSFRNTNKKLITLAPGANNFTISGATNFTITFDFRFKYL